jgi:aerobic carbon-monoxide dehydrogenase medium subunit
VSIRSAEGERVLGMHEFHVGPYMTAVGAAEMLTEIRIPIRPGAGSAHEKVERRAGDYAISAVSAAVWVDGGSFADVGVALGASGPFTIDVVRATELMRGQAPSEELFEQAGEIAAEDSMPMPDSRGPVDYKRHLVGVLTKRALRRATARALRQEA